MAEQRLIDEKKLDFSKCIVFASGNTVYANFEAIMKEIDRAPTINPESLRPVGHWVAYDGYTECSNCEYWYDAPETETADDRTPYCPYCGAKMVDASDGGAGR